jgi:hypothetical protein
MAKPTLAVNVDTLEKLRDGQPWGVFAKQIGIDGSTLSRIRHGEARPGPEFIAKLVTAYPVRIEDVVTVVAA